MDTQLETLNRELRGSEERFRALLESITDDCKASALQGDETASFEFPIYTKSGDRVAILCHPSVRRDASRHRRHDWDRPRHHRAEGSPYLKTFAITDNSWDEAKGVACLPICNVTGEAT